MTLISMLIALIVERLAVRSPAWQLVSYVRPYLRYSKAGLLATLMSHQAGVVLWWLLPAIAVTILLVLADFWLVTLLVNTVVLLLCMGCWHYRQLYKQYLNAAERQDQEAAYLVMQQISQQSGMVSDDLTHGERLIWLNFKYYAAVLFWFAVLGAFGALCYAMLRQLAEPVTYPQPDAPADVMATEDNSSQPADAALAMQQQLQGFAIEMSHWADWLPVRLFGLGLALVGHFSRASAALISYLVDSSTPAEIVLADIARAAEPLPDEQRNCSAESCSLVQLSKRNILFFLAIVAVLTLSGLLS